MFKIIKAFLVGVAVSLVGLLRVASAQNEIKTAMEAIQTDVSSNLGIMVPIILTIIGLIIGALVTVGVMKKLGFRIG